MSVGGGGASAARRARTTMSWRGGGGAGGGGGVGGEARPHQDVGAGGERAGGVGGRGLAGQVEGLAAAPAEVDGAAVAAAAGLLHPGVAAEGLEGRRAPQLR